MDYTDEDMAAVGRAFMEEIEQARMVDPWVKDWSPSQCPSEIIFHLINQRDEAQELAIKIAGKECMDECPSSDSLGPVLSPQVADERQQKNEREMAEGTRCNGLCEDGGLCNC